MKIKGNEEPTEMERWKRERNTTAEQLRRKKIAYPHFGVILLKRFNEIRADNRGSALVN